MTPYLNFRGNCKPHQFGIIFYIISREEIMVLAVLILLIWVVILQYNVNSIQEQLHELKKGNSPEKPQAAQRTPFGLPPVNPHPVVPGIKSTPQTNSNTPAVQGARITNTPANQKDTDTPKPAKPPVEITAAKLFSWIGGFMLFLGCVFGIKYAVENSVLSPALRITISTLSGCALALIGYLIKNPKYRVTAHTLLGSGLAIAYTAVFCAHTFYHFINLTSAFLFMALISFTALGASLKKEAKYVGYLGAVIAFLTPFLLHNGADAWVAFFLYVFCINAAAAYAAVRKGWNGLLICTLCFTWLSQAAWLFPLAQYKLLGVVTFFSLYALASTYLARQQKAPSVISHAIGGFLCMSLALMFPVAGWLSAPVVSQIPNVLLASFELLGYVLLVNLLILIAAGKNYLAGAFSRIAKILSFLILCTWMCNQAAHLPLWLTLGACLLFAAINGGADMVCGRNKQKPDCFSLFYPVATMAVLFMVSLFVSNTPALDFISVWGALALLLMGTLALAILFLFLAGCVYVAIGDKFFLSFMIGMGIMPLFLCVTLLAALRGRGLLKQITAPEKAVGAITALTPFALILTIIGQNGTLISYHWVLGTAWLVCALSVLTARLYKSTFTLPAAAGGATLVQLTLWNLLVWGYRFAPVGTLCLWALAFLALFLLIPFLSKTYFWEKNGTWTACVIAGLGACLMECLLLSHYHGYMYLGSIPAVLLGIYALLLHQLWGDGYTPKADPASVGVMAGAVMAFLTLIFPLQIHSYWLWFAWSAEAVFLAFLNKILPYRAWKIANAILVCVISAWLLLGGFTYSVASVRICIYAA